MKREVKTAHVTTQQQPVHYTQVTIMLSLSGEMSLNGVGEKWLERKHKHQITRALMYVTVRNWSLIARQRSP